MTRLFTPLSPGCCCGMGVSPGRRDDQRARSSSSRPLCGPSRPGHLLLGTLIITVFVLTDSLDGVMARQAGRSGPWGAFLDSTMDRFGDGAIFAGLVLWFTAGGDDRLTAILALVCLVLGSIVPYARARAEGLGMTASGGIAERADRLVLVLVATAVVGMGAPTVVLTIVLALLAVASAITIVQRMSKVYRQASAGVAQ